LKPLHEMKAVELKNEEDDDDEATNERLQKLFNVMSDLSQQIESGLSQQSQEQPQQQDCAIDFLRVLVDLTDDVQTVENLFDFAFLIKVISPIISMPYLN